MKVSANDERGFESCYGDPICTYILYIYIYYIYTYKAESFMSAWVYIYILIYICVCVRTHVCMRMYVNIVCGR